MSLAPLMLLALQCMSAAPKAAVPRAQPSPKRPVAAIPSNPSSPAAAFVQPALKVPFQRTSEGIPRTKVPTLEGRNGKDLGFWASRSNSSEKRDWNEFWWRQLSSRRDLAWRGWALFG